jgi:EAL domain-containing protein (putative c-di-GMP-specific phosphodiesterase class I)
VDLLVAVNMSVEQLEDRGLTELLAQWPSSDGLRGLIVEIVESVFLPDRHVAVEALRDLISHGALTAIDDYGSGYSNMRLLESIAPHFIKLDRSFLSEQHRMESRAALIRSVVELSHVIGARVIAEGVEEEAQHELLRATGADLVQGNVIAPPMPLDELLLWLSDRRG